MMEESAREVTFTGVSPPRMADIGICDGCGSKKITAGATVTSLLLSEVASSLRLDWGIGLEMVEISVMPDSVHGAAISSSE